MTPKLAAQIAINWAQSLISVAYAAIMALIGAAIKLWYDVATLKQDVAKLQKDDSDRDERDDGLRDARAELRTELGKLGTDIDWIKRALSDKGKP